MLTQRQWTLTLSSTPMIDPQLCFYWDAYTCTHISSEGEAVNILFNYSCGQTIQTIPNTEHWGLVKITNTHGSDSLCTEIELSRVFISFKTKLWRFLKLNLLYWDIIQIKPGEMSRWVNQILNKYEGWIQMPRTHIKPEVVVLTLL